MGLLQAVAEGHVSMSACQLGSHASATSSKGGGGGVCSWLPFFEA
jgi:hypothetical protein